MYKSLPPSDITVASVMAACEELSKIIDAPVNVYRDAGLDVTIGGSGFE